jgi:hypothetical protein
MPIAMRVFIDTNIFLDLLCRRERFLYSTTFSLIALFHSSQGNIELFTQNFQLNNSQLNN